MLFLDMVDGWLAGGGFDLVCRVGERDVLFGKDISTSEKIK